LGDAGCAKRSNIRLNLNRFNEASRRNKESRRPIVSFRRHCGVVQSNRRSRSALARCTERTKVSRSGLGAAGIGNKLFTSSSGLGIYQERAMSIFGKIMSAIFGTSANATPASGGAAAGGAASSGGASAAPAAPAQTVDVAPILDKAVAAKKEKLEWRTSIVDLMKALDVDSSLAARKDLAKELHYTGDTNDSATMNMWLHKQMMAQLAANGGKLPADVKW
jgi:hypothetical protein